MYISLIQRIHTQPLFIALVIYNKGDGAQVQSALAEWTGQRTVPNVFIGEKHIGGCDCKRTRAQLSFHFFFLKAFSNFSFCFSLNQILLFSFFFVAVTNLHRGGKLVPLLTVSKPSSKIRSSITKARQGDNMPTEVEGPSRARKTSHTELTWSKQKQKGGRNIKYDFKDT